MIISEQNKLNVFHTANLHVPINRADFAEWAFEYFIELCISRGGREEFQ